jgi:hypothetical protein
MKKFIWKKNKNRGNNCNKKISNFSMSDQKNKSKYPTLPMTTLSNLLKEEKSKELNLIRSKEEMSNSDYKEEKKLIIRSISPTHLFSRKKKVDSKIKISLIFLAFVITSIIDISKKKMF